MSNPKETCVKKALVQAALSLFMLIVFTTSVYPQWIPTNWSESNSFFNLYTSQDMVFARTWDSLNGGRMFLTANNGANWTEISSADSDIGILSIVMLNDNRLLAGTWNGFYLSPLDGTAWNAVTPTGIPADTAIWSIAMIDTTLFAGTTGDIYESSDNGNTWTNLDSGIPVNARITSIVASGNAIFAGSDSKGVFITTDGGTSWTSINSGLTDTHISQLVALDTKLFAVTLNGVFVSENNGTSWEADSSSLKNINCFVVVNDQLFAGTDDSGVYLSVDSGATWTSFSSGMPASTRVWSLAASSDNFIFAGTSSGVWRMPTVPNAAPTIATAASAIPNPVTGTTTALSVLGADDVDEANLTYRWATTGTPPAAVTFSANGTNAAKATTATFAKAGSYAFQVTVRDAGSLTATSSVSVTVNQTLTSIVLSPTSATVNTSAKQQFIATARDQFATSLATQPTFTWSVKGGGTISSSGLFAAGTIAGGPYTVTAQSGGALGTASVTIATVNQAPTVATAASASPNPVTGNTTSLSVSGADDGGEANLVYTWATSGTPPAAVTFSANGTNAAKNTTATFSKAGTYNLGVTIKDQGNLTATSAVSVTVSQTLTAINVTPASASVAASSSQQFTASAVDQFGNLMLTQPGFTWSVSGGRTISSSGLFTAGTTAGGPYTVTAQSSGVSGTASVTVTQAIVYQINCGGSASSPYTADQYYSGGRTYSVTSTITTTGVTNPAPQAVYRTERYGTVTYTLPSLTSRASYKVRLHFSENYWTATGKRKFNVVINGTMVLSNYDIYAETGARYKAVVKEYTATAHTSGQIVIKFTTVTDNAKIGGIEIIRQ